MRNKRMFSLDVVDTDCFLEMSVSAQALYFHLGMRADDDGFVSSPKKITSMTNCGLDDFKMLIAKKAHPLIKKLPMNILKNYGRCILVKRAKGK